MPQRRLSSISCSFVLLVSSITQILLDGFSESQQNTKKRAKDETVTLECMLTGSSRRGVHGPDQTSEVMYPKCSIYFSKHHPHTIHPHKVADLCPSNSQLACTIRQVYDLTLPHKYTVNIYMNTQPKYKDIINRHPPKSIQ